MKRAAAIMVCAFSLAGTSLVRAQPPGGGGGGREAGEPAEPIITGDLDTYVLATGGDQRSAFVLKQDAPAPGWQTGRL
jgi:hypothetical protein